MSQQPRSSDDDAPSGAIQETLLPDDSPSFAAALLALASIPGVGYRALRALVGAYGTDLGLLLTAPPPPSALRRLKAPKALVEALAGPRPDLIERGQEQQSRLAGRAVALLGPDHLPARLARLPDRPHWLFVQGDPAALTRAPHVAVVGTREASTAGTEATGAAVRMMAPYPITLVSGLANGIDASAHARALEFGLTNVAFLGHGIDLVFPAETARLRERIIEQGGAVATEYLPGDRYRREQFVQRNRLQAGLAEIVVAAEGTASSGTAHTVRFAARYATPLIGLQWSGAGDLTRLVAESGGSLLDVFTPSGRRELDGLLRGMAETHGHTTNALALIERQLAWEAQQRGLRDEDLLHLQDLIDHFRKGEC